MAEEPIEKLSPVYGKSYKEAVIEVIQGAGLPGTYAKDLLDKIHSIALPRSGGRASADARKRRADEGLGVGEGMEEPMGEQGELKKDNTPASNPQGSATDPDAEVVGDVPREGAISYDDAHPGGTALASINETWTPAQAQENITKAKGNAAALWKMHAFNKGPEDVIKGYDYAHHKGSGNQACVKSAVDKCIRKCATMTRGLEKNVQKQDDSLQPQAIIDESVLQTILQHLNQHAEEFDAVQEQNQEDADANQPPVAAPTPPDAGQPTPPGQSAQGNGGTQQNIQKAKTTSPLAYSDCHTGSVQKASKGTKFNYSNEKEDAGGNQLALKTMHAAFDGGNPRDPSSWSFAHHKATPGHKVVLDGLLQCHDKLEKCVSKGDGENTVKGVRAHLAKHFSSFNEQPPWLSEGKMETDDTESGLKPEGTQVKKYVVQKDDDAAKIVLGLDDDELLRVLAYINQNKGDVTKSQEYVIKDPKEDKIIIGIGSDTLLDVLALLREMKPEGVAKTAHGKQSAPIADTGSWNGAAARQHLLAWAGGPDKDNVNWQKYGRGFLYHDPNNADNIGGYKFPVADIIDGKFQISRAALSAAAQRMNQTAGIPPNELDSMKATMRSYYKQIGAPMPDNIAKILDAPIQTDVPLYSGKTPLVTFIGASPGVIEGIRKEAMVGPTGKTFDNAYLKPLGLTRDQIGVTYLVPNVLKTDDGRTREPTEYEIAGWTGFTKANLQEIGSPLTVGLGYTVKDAIGKDLDFTLPHPNSLYGQGRQQELDRKVKQMKKALREVKKARRADKSLNKPTGKN